jgi:hypothetical protein
VGLQHRRPVCFNPNESGSAVDAARRVFEETLLLPVLHRSVEDGRDPAFIQAQP